MSEYTCPNCNVHMMANRQPTHCIMCRRVPKYQTPTIKQTEDSTMKKKIIFKRKE